MGIKLSEVEVGSKLVLHLSKGKKKMTMNARMVESIRDDIAIIEIDYDTTRTLSFDGINIDLEYIFQDTMPIIWNRVRIVAYKSRYALQTSIDGARKNRRSCYRVGVSTAVQYRKEGHGMQKVVLRDISLSGFSIADDEKRLRWHEGDRIEITIDDIGYVLNLFGKVVRIDDRKTKTIYGLEICNLCKDLSSYISMKQRRVVRSNLRVATRE